MSSPTTGAKKASVLSHQQARYGSTAHKTTLFLEPPLSIQASKNAPPETDLTSRKNRERTNREKGGKGSVQEGGNLVDSTRDNPGLGAARSNDDKGVR